LAHHQRFGDSPSFREVVAPIGPAFAGPPDVSHVQFTSDVTIPFKRPVTEILFHISKSPEDRQKVLGHFAELTKNLGSSATYGPLVEKDTVAVFVAGWESVEVSIPSSHSRMLLTVSR
jgi:hypothetical protein